MTARWFFALWPERATAAALAARAGALIPAGARAAHPLDLHLTLRFLGELSPPQVQLAVQAAAAVRAPALRLDIDGAGCFPRPRILWCGPSQVPAALSVLVERLDAGLTGLGFAPEPRPFRPHVTLARGFAGGATLDWGPPVAWEARTFCLAHGRTGQVPRYVVAGRWPLAPPG